MRCKQACEMMSLRLDGRLDSVESTLLDEHLAECNACQTEWQRLQALHCMLAAAPVVPAPVRVRVNVMVRLSRRDQARRAIVGGTALALGTVTLALIMLAPAILGVLSTTGIGPALFNGGPETAVHVLGAWETLGRTMMVLCKNAIVPLAFVGLCGLATVLALSGLWIGLVRRMRAR
jgi:predicted anti-sigma-YlaC factor YlaD